MRIVDFIRNGKLSTKEERTVYLVDGKSFNILIERDNKTSFFILEDYNCYPFVVGMVFTRMVIFDDMSRKLGGYDIKDILEEDDSYLALKYGKMLFRSIYG